MKIMNILVMLVLVSYFGIVMADAKNQCFPTWSKPSIIVEGMNKATGSKEVVRGNYFNIETNVFGASGCEYGFRWEVLKNKVPSRAIEIADIYNENTVATVTSDATPGDSITVKGVYYFPDDPNGQTSEQEVVISVVDEPLPPEIFLNVEGVAESNRSFKVNWSLSKAHGNSNNFVRMCSLYLYNDETKLFIDDNWAEAAYGKPRPLISLMPKGPGIYRIEAICEDSLGIQGTTIDYVLVGLSDLTSNKPFLIVEDTIYCGLECVIDFSKTNTFNKSIKVEIYDVTTGKDVALNYKCGEAKCTISFNNSGEYKVKLVSRYYWAEKREFVYSSKAETIITVIVGQDQAEVVSTVSVPGEIIPEITEMQSASPGGSYLPASTPSGHKKTPGMTIIATIVVMIFVYMRLYNNSK